MTRTECERTFGVSVIVHHPSALPPTAAAAAAAAARNVWSMLHEQLVCYVFVVFFWPRIKAPERVQEPPWGIDE